LVAHDWQLNLRATNHPEFDAWRWNDYWVPLDSVVEFKRGVYEMALTELERYLPRYEPRPRFFKSNGQTPDQNMERHGGKPQMELPPGGVFDPDPQSGVSSE